MLSPEFVGYVGGAISSVSLIPQVVHTYRTNSAKDLSYAWQLIHLTGLCVDVVYMMLLGATAGWITLLIEIFFVLMLLGMKVQLEWQDRSNGTSCGAYYHATTKVDDETIECSSEGSDGSEESLDLEQPIIPSDTPDVVVRIPHAPPPIEVDDASGPLRFHVEIPATCVSLDFGAHIAAQLNRLARHHDVSLWSTPRVDAWDDTCVGAPWHGFAVSTWMGDCSLSILGRIHEPATVTVDCSCPSRRQAVWEAQPSYRAFLEDLVDTIRWHLTDDGASLIKGGSIVLD